MIFDKAHWEIFAKDYFIYDGTIGFEDGRYGLVLLARSTDEDDVEQENLVASLRILFIKADEPMVSRFGAIDLDGLSDATISASYPPGLTEYVAVDSGRTVCAFKPRMYQALESEIVGNLPDSNLVSSISRITRVGASLYAIGSPFRVYKRVGPNHWDDHSASIPIPASFRPGSLYGHSLNDISGFAEDDIYTVGGKGNVWRYDGKMWQQIGFPTNLELNTVTCAGDGNVYITDTNCSVWRGRNSKWELVVKQKKSLNFFDGAWFDNRFWCANDYGIWVLENDKLIEGDQAVFKPIPRDMLGLCGRIDTSPDGTKMLTCGPDGAAVYDGATWEILFERKELE